MRPFVFFQQKSPVSIRCFPCFRQDFIFYQSRGVAPGRGRDARANDANQAILAEDADLQLWGMVRGWKIFSGIRRGSRCIGVGWM